MTPLCLLSLIVAQFFPAFNEVFTELVWALFCCYLNERSQPSIFCRGRGGDAGGYLSAGMS